MTPITPITPDGYILLVEDNPGDARLTQALLLEVPSDAAPTLRWAQTVAQAARTLADEPDCRAVLLDLGLPDSQGLQGLHALQALAADCPFIVLTGDGSATLGADAVAAGAQDFLVKGGFDSAQLRRCIGFAAQRLRLARREMDRQRQAALADAVAARDELREVLARVGDGFVALDRDGRYTYLNPPAVRLSGRQQADELLGRSIWTEFPGLANQPLGVALRRAMATQSVVLTEAFDQPFSGWIESRIHPSPQGLTIYLSDTSARRDAEQARVAFQFELSQLTQRLLDQERKTTQRVAQTLHDQLGQTLAVARLNLEACVRLHAATMPSALTAQVENIADLLNQAVREVRHVLVDLRPPLLEDQGLAAALDNEIRSRSDAGVDLLLEVADGLAGQRWPDEVEYAAFMVAREAVANALLHAGGSLVRVLLDGDAAGLALAIVDDGVGISPALAHGRPGHLGLVGMRERGLAIGAAFAAAAEPAGGTRITLRWPAPPP